MQLKFRPHHFLCTLGFEGKGYSDEFVRNYSGIATLLRETGARGDETLIQVEPAADSICMPCPNRDGQGCLSEPKISKLDHAHARILGLTSGDVLSWSEAKDRIRERMSLEDFHAACAPCSWKSLGVCEAALIRLKNQDDSKNFETSPLTSDSSRSLSRQPKPARA
jgi:hypothetical protein